MRVHPGIRSVVGLSRDGTRLAVQDDTAVHVCDAAGGGRIAGATVEREGVSGLRRVPGGDRLLQVHAAGKVRWLTAHAMAMFNIGGKR